MQGIGDNTVAATNLKTHGQGHRRGLVGRLGWERGIPLGGAAFNNSSDEGGPKSVAKGTDPPFYWSSPMIRPTCKSPHCLQRPRQQLREVRPSSPVSPMEGVAGVVPDFSSNSDLGHHCRRRRVNQDR